MKHLALLAALYALTAVLVLPGTLFAQESPEAPDAGVAPAQDVPEAAEPPAQAPVAAGEPAPAAPAPASAPAPAPAGQAGAPPAGDPPPEAPAAAEAQLLADERDAPRRKRKATAAASTSVTIVDFAFQPATVTISEGDTVTWVNEGPTPHSATAPDGSFDTGIFPAGQRRSHTFAQAGTYSYICTPHPNMRGTVVVRASQSGGAGGAGGQGTSGGESAGAAAGGASGGGTAEADGGPALPNSGADAGALLLLGGLMLLLGAAVHRRARGDQPQPAGRIGW